VRYWPKRPRRTGAGWWDGWNELALVLLGIAVLIYALIVLRMAMQP
jgi:hypothetical protein